MRLLATTLTLASLVAPLSAAGLTASDLAQQIDFQIQAKINAEKTAASPLCLDAEFIRRVYLDIVGVIPPADKVAQFLDSKDPAKRAKLVDELLADPRFGKRMADIWLGLMVDRTSDQRRTNYTPLHDWLAEKFNANTPWNQFVHELITASGEADKNGAVIYFFSNNTVDKITDSVTKLFLGVQLQCAQCHNHPFTAWKQEEYWGMAQFFTKVSFNGNPNQLAKKGMSPAVSETTGRRGTRLPDSALRVAPKFLQGEQPQMPSGPYRPILADWLTTKDNPFFARAMVNRLWHQFYGRGLVNPVDDMHLENTPSHPELLNLLSAQFIASDFDVKHMIRSYCASRTYQRTSKPIAANKNAEPALYSRMAIKAMTPEQLYDSLEAVLGKQGGGGPRARQQQQRGNVSPRDAFVAFFAGEEGALPTEYQAGVPQALRLMNANQYNSANNQLLREVKGMPPEQAVERIYLATLARRPTPAEAKKLTAHIAQAGETAGHGDVLWAVLNSSEFTLNH